MQRFPASPAAARPSRFEPIRRASLYLALSLLALLPRPAATAEPAGLRTPFPLPKAATGSSSPGSWVGFESRLVFFTATTAEEGEELWVSDGTASGTRLLVDACPGACSSDPIYLAAGGGRAYFSLLGDLWSTNGAPQRTRRLTTGLRLYPGTETWSEELGLFFFRATDFDDTSNVIHGSEPWVSDGTVAGTHLLADLNPGFAASAPSFFVSLGSRVLFIASDPLHGAEVWTTDGTARGTRLLKEMVRGPTSPRVLDNLIEAGDKIYFVADTGSGEELWSTRGTGATTVQLTRFLPATPFAASFGLRFLTLHKGDLYFFADDGSTGQEPWRSDGTPGGTGRIADVCPGACSSGFQFSEAGSGSRLYFSADDGAHGQEVWESDGTASGTRLAFDACPGACTSLTELFGTHGETTFFAARDFGTSLGPNMLWKVDPSGPIQLTAPAGGTEVYFDRRYTPSPVIGSRFYFSAFDDTHGAEPWLTDGTPEGTCLLLDLVP